KAPFPAPSVAPVAAGVPSVSDQVIVLAGMSESVAVTVKARFASSFVVLLPGFVTTGAEFTSFTVTVIVSKSLSAGLPLSVTRTVPGNVPLDEGVQLKAPDEAPIVAPEGAPASSEKVSVLAGTSESVAVAVKVTGEPTVPDFGPIVASTGAEFTSFTVMVKDAELARSGQPLSVAVTVTGYDPGPCASSGVRGEGPVW